ncbi:YceI family protein [Rubrivirga sp. IMCC43871]|uniref:YceI family protein n=1 Tax=Rubrivirga sp. IMCC43871 TaxID=3391575 RepID=UPI00399033BD
MPTRFTTSFTLLALMLGLAGWLVVERYTFTDASRVWVTGTSTVHDWSCDADVTATLDATTASGALTGLSALTVSTPVAQMDCDNGTMNGKLRDALGSSPVRFVLTTARVGTPNNGRFLVEADGRLTIHGTTRTQRVRAQGRVLSGGRFQFTGEVPVTMSQFGVDPPRALAGTLRTGDAVTVHFDVVATR